MAKPIKKQKNIPVRNELDSDLQIVFDSAESDLARIMIVFTQMLRHLKRIK